MPLAQTKYPLMTNQTLLSVNVKMVMMEMERKDVLQHARKMVSHAEQMRTVFSTPTNTSDCANAIQGISEIRPSNVKRLIVTRRTYASINRGMMIIVTVIDSQRSIKTRRRRLMTF
jgi:ribosomal protein L34E